MKYRTFECAWYQLENTLNEYIGYKLKYIKYHYSASGEDRELSIVSVVMERNDD